MRQAAITGMGWVSKSSRGYPGHVHYSKHANCLPRISGKDILNRPHKAFGRMDNFSKMGFSAITFALADAGIPLPGPKNIVMIASSVTGCLETDIQYQTTLSRKNGILPSPTLFAYTLPSCFLGEAAIYHGITGESFMVEEEIGNGLRGLSLGLDLMEQGKSDTLVCGICNSDLYSEVKMAGANNEDSFPEPGALFFVLEKKADRSCHGTITEDTALDIFSHEDKKIISLTDLGKTIQKSAQGKII